MWIPRAEYTSLVTKAALTEKLQQENVSLGEQLTRATVRADQAIDDLLISRGHPPVSPPPQSLTNIDGLWDEDPDEVEKILKRKAVTDGE
jgi:hypothetical protein